MADSSNASANDLQRLIPASMPDFYAQRNTFQRKMNITALDFFQPTLAHRPNLNQQFLDVGCGTGDFTRTELLPRSQPCQRIVATDTILKMIEYAQKHFAHPQIAYEEHDIRGDMSGLIAKYGQFDRVYSFYTLNWVQDQTTTLRNIGNLMKDDGDCVLVFAARTAVRKIWKRLVEMDRWKQYDQPSKSFIAKTQDLEDREALMSYMYETLKNANLNPLSCEVLTSVHSAEVSDRTIGIRGAVSMLLPLLPEETRKQFMTDLEDVIHKFWTEKDPADPQYHVDTFVIHATKL
ncbi:unnamed protein product [Ixodes persulcatus]